MKPRLVLGGLFLVLGGSILFWPSPHAFNRLDSSPGAVVLHGVKQNRVTASRLETSVSKLYETNSVNRLIIQKREVEALLRLRPELAAEIPSLLKKKGATPRAKLALIHSLSEVQGGQAEAALREIARSSEFEKNLRLQAIVSSTDLSVPEFETINVLRTLSAKTDEIGSASLLALGAIASNVRMTMPEVSREIIAELIGKLTVAEEFGPSAATVAMDALGNTGSPEISSIADRYVNSPASGERALGASVLRKVPEAWADETLLTLLDSDESPVVRRAAIETLSIRSSSDQVVTRVAELLFEEPDPTTRGSIILYLERQISTSRGAREVLKELLVHEPDRENRLLIQRILGSQV